MSTVGELVMQEVEIDGQCAAVIQLTQGKVAFVDVPDLARISARLWTANVAAVDLERSWLAGGNK